FFSKSVTKGGPKQGFRSWLGSCRIISVYSSSRQLITTRELLQSDVVMLLSGGHGFRMIKDTVLLEIKQGPYFGLSEKERFDP
ncbi:hypothetical protein MYX64_04695, partial [Nitrospinae bacterium AH_259_B05_G02_I21]|nr:hypothetical protein [Nitrospinae bacterium AH_259_B05_G02_I21]